ncbi:MAG: TVP38/TMEM64 family protein [Clostridium sp.]
MFKIKKSSIITITTIILLTLIYLFVGPVNSIINQMVFYLTSLNIDALKEYILSFGVWAPITSFILMILQSIIAPIPAFMITLSNAAVFGWWQGAILSWSSAMAGAGLCFIIARFLGRGAVDKLTSRYALDGVDNFFNKYGKHTILIARLLPFISFDIVSYAAGLTSMRFWGFFLATGIGQLPATLVYSYVGKSLTGGAKALMIGLMCLFAMSVLIYIIKMVYNEKSKVASREI